MSSNKMPVDLELKKAFQELQAKMISTSQQLKVSDLQIEQLKKQITHAQLIGKDLDILSSDVPCYKSIGRMFLKMPLTDIKEGMRKDIREYEDKIKNIEGTKSYLERTLKESEENLREMVIAKQREQIH